jgi:hypothetical protein
MISNFRTQRLPFARLTMRNRTVAAAIASSAMVVTWALSDALADICPVIQSGCTTNFAVPCTGNGGLCSKIAPGNPPPDGITTCSDMTAATYWSATTPPTIWKDCIPQGGLGPCRRTAKLCNVVTLYKSLDDCVNDIECFFDPIDACALVIEITCPD